MKVSASLLLVLLVFTGPALQTTHSSAQLIEPFEKVSISIPILMFGAPLGVRNLGLGAAGVADDSDPNNSFYNPANLQSHAFYYVTVSHNEWVRHTTLSLDTYDAGLYGGTSLPFESIEVRLGFGAKFTQLRFTDNIERTIFLPEGTGQDTRRDWYMLLSGAIGVGIGPVDIGTGVSLKPYNIDWIDTQVNEWAFDAGFIAKVALLEDGPVVVTPSAGASTLNLGEDAELGSSFVATLPREARYGVGLRLASRARSELRFLGNGPILSLSGILDSIRPQVDGVEKAVAYGLEMGLFDALFLRRGAVYRDQSETRTTWGVGLALHAGTVILRGDYAHVEGGANQLFSLEDTNAFSVALAYDI